MLPFFWAGCVPPPRQRIRVIQLPVCALVFLAVATIGSKLKPTLTLEHPQTGIISRSGSGRVRSKLYASARGGSGVGERELCDR